MEINEYYLVMVRHRLVLSDEAIGYYDICPAGAGRVVQEMN